MRRKTVSGRMDRPSFLRRLRELAATSGNIFIVRHARQRMVERGYTDEDVVRVLSKGMIDEGPFLNGRGNWQATIYRMHAGQEIRVAAALESGIVVITVI